MRRAAIQLLRSARRPTLRKVVRRQVSFTPSNALSQRYLSRQRPSNALLTSSMHLRGTVGALVAGAVASGAYYWYNGSHPPGVATTADQYRSVTTDAQAETTRRALVVDQVGSLYTGTITGDAPLSKDTDDYGRKVLEMLTPEQATAKLRKTEESWIVGRGQGVVRYDVVQIPSNDPIEDDHAEKIIEVPQNLAATENGQTSTDWMFWGVFDGHRYTY
jgi:pyruvate dehydrogenase phosphatase